MNDFPRHDAQNTKEHLDKGIAMHRLHTLLAGWSAEPFVPFLSVVALIFMVRAAVGAGDTRSRRVEAGNTDIDRLRALAVKQFMRELGPTAKSCLNSNCRGLSAQA